ncbi:hypothetical protein D3C81_643000 [compost metagenome]
MDMDKIEKYLFELDKYISEVRDTLNEISVTCDEEAPRLQLSQYLDELIVEYMKLKMNKIEK